MKSVVGVVSVVSVVGGEEMADTEEERYCGECKRWGGDRWSHCGGCGLR